MLEGKRIAVIGGTSGIGFEVAQAASSAGARVTVASRTRENIDTALERLGQGAQGDTLDVREEETIGQFFARNEKFDGVVSTVGIACRSSEARDMRRQDVKEHFETKYWGQFFVARHAAENLQPGGVVVLTTGIPASRPMAGYAYHSSISAALEALVRAFALELAPVRVNAVCPGVIQSERLFSELSAEARASRLQTNESRPIPTRRIGSTGDVAQSFLFALSNSHLNGQVLVVDGGCSLL